MALNSVRTYPGIGRNDGCSSRRYPFPCQALLRRRARRLPRSPQEAFPTSRILFDSLSNALRRARAASRAGWVVRLPPLASPCQRQMLSGKRTCALEDGHDATSAGGSTGSKRGLRSCTVECEVTSNKTI